MNCPKCGTKIDELTEICPKCRVNRYETNGKKTILLGGINVIQIIFFIIAAIACWIDGEVLNGFINFGYGLIIFALIKGFEDIIDLLDSINNKLSR